MTKERWREILDKIKSNFKILDEGQDEIEDEGGVFVDFIEFEGPLGRIRLEFISKPLVIDKKTNYSRRSGSETQVSYIYSETERSEKIVAYKWNNANSSWEEMDAKNFF